MGVLRDLLMSMVLIEGPVADTNPKIIASGPD